MRKMKDELSISARTSGSLNEVCIRSRRGWMSIEGKPSEQPTHENRECDKGAAIHPADQGLGAQQDTGRAEDPDANPKTNEIRRPR